MTGPRAASLTLCLCSHILGFHLGAVSRPHLAVISTSPLVHRAPLSRVTALDADSRHRVKAAGMATLASLAILTSPMAAHAKGGGRGGGGGGRSSTSRSASYRSTANRYDGDYTDMMFLVGGGRFLVWKVQGKRRKRWRERFPREHEKHKARVDELEAALAHSTSDAGHSPPKSGEYWGASNEDDHGDQSIRTTLEFRSDGRVSGRGIDDADGSYSVTGRWAPRTGRYSTEYDIVWTERYHDDLLTLCEGVYNSATGRIVATFASDRGVRGTFHLKAK